MTYAEIGRFTKALQDAYNDFRLKASIVLAVQTHMNLDAYDDEGFEEICDNFDKAIIDSINGWPEFGSVAYRAQTLIDAKKYETPSVECFKEALTLEGYARKKAYVVVMDEYDYDGPNNDRLISCATFSDIERANRYVDEKLSQYDDVHGTCAYDEDGIMTIRFRVIETEIDEFDKM